MATRHSWDLRSRSPSFSCFLWPETHPWSSTLSCQPTAHAHLHFQLCRFICRKNIVKLFLWCSHLARSSWSPLAYERHWNESSSWWSCHLSPSFFKETQKDPYDSPYHSFSSFQIQFQQASWCSCLHLSHHYLLFSCSSGGVYHTFTQSLHPARAC